MRLSNRNKTARYNFTNSVLLVLLFTGVLAFMLERTKFDVLGWESCLFIVVPLLLIGFYLIKGRQIFEYDSDGETLNFKNRNVVPLLGHSASDEFPKYKLESFEVVNAILFKRLYIRILSKKNHSLVLKYDVSFLSNKELRDLKISLAKVTKNNTENPLHSGGQ